MTAETLSFGPFSRRLRERVERAVLGQLGPANDQLRALLAHDLSRPIGHPESFLADPLLEGLFEWEAHPHTLAEVPFLHPDTLRALSQSVAGQEEHAFRAEWHFYLH